MLAHSSKSTTAMVIILRERTPTYGRDWYRERGGSPTAHHPITVAAEKRMRRRIGGARWREIREMSGRLNERLEGDLLRTWLALEGNLYAYLLEIAAEHYNMGVEASLEEGATTTGVPTVKAAVRSGLKDRLKDLLKALSEEVDRLP